MIAPAARTRISGQGFTTIRWSAADRDRDLLTSQIEFSRDGGKNYQIITAGVRGRVAVIRNSSLAPTKKGRLRVTVNDGFNASSTTVSPVLVAPRRPFVSILSPQRALRASNADTVVLSGDAREAQGKRLPDSRLRWYVNGRFAGSGRHSAFVPLRTGAITITLTVSDSRGLEGKARVQIRVFPVQPQFVTLQVPTVVSRNAGHVRVHVSANVRGTMTVAGSRFAVGPTARAISVPLAPSATQTRLFFSLMAGGKTTTVARIVDRP
jgi:hypothetical protein